MSEFSRLRREVKADIELMAIRQGDMATEVEGIASDLRGGLQEVSQQVKGVIQRVQEIAQEVEVLGQKVQTIADKTVNDTGRLSREVAAGSRWMQGRMRLLGERFDAMFGALEREQFDDRELLHDLRDRVVRLEGERPPAA